MYERCGGISAGQSTGGYGCRMRRSASRQVCVPQEKLISGSSLAEWTSVWIVATLVIWRDDWVRKRFLHKAQYLIKPKNTSSTRANRCW